MRRHTILYACLLLLLVIPATTMAASIGEGNVTLNSSGNFTITPVNSSQPYTVSNVSVLGALQAGSEAGGFNYTVADDLPAERGYLTVTSIDEIENDLMNDTPRNWTYLINGEQFTAGVAQKRVSDGDNVTFVYGPANDTQRMPEYTLMIFVSVTGDMADNQTMDNVTDNQTMDNVTDNQTMDNVTGNMTVVEVIDGEQNLTTLSAAINATNLTEPLSGEGPYTVFAPDDEAFDELGNETIGELLNDTENLTEILQYHVVEGNYTAEQLMEMVQQNMTGNQTMDNAAGNMTQNQTGNVTQNQTMDQNMTGQQEGVVLRTLLGENLTLTLNQTTDELMVNNATVVTPDLNASNGVVHIIDAVLMPPSMAAGNQTMDNVTDNQTADGNTPNITVTDQPIVNDSVVIKEAVAKRDNWIVIHADQSGAPGPVIGTALIARGVNDNVTVQIETENATKTLYAMLHNDAGRKGVFEFPGSDRPETVMGEVVVQPFNVTMDNVTGNQTMDNVTDNQTMDNMTGMPNVTIIMPENGSNVSAGNVTVEVNITNFSLVDKLGQAPVSGEGHAHYYLDVAPPTEQGQPAVPENGSYAVSTNTTYTWENVTPGMHNFSVQLVNNDHTPIIPLVTDTVNVTVTEQADNQTMDNVTDNQTMDNVTDNQTMDNVTDNQTMDNVSAMQLQLYEGWNFISIPTELTEGNDTIEAVFQDVDMAGREVYRFTQASGWETLENDTVLEVLDAYWVYSNETTNVTLNVSTDPVNVPASKDLAEGWSGIGLADTEPRSANETLQSVEENWVYLLGYDAETQQYEQVIINGAQGENQTMVPMKGYWLFMRDPGSLGALTV